MGESGVGILEAASIASVTAACRAIRGGGAVVVTGELEGSLVAAAGSATRELIAFMVRHTSGFLVVALPEPECERLVLPPMHARDNQRSGLSHRVTVDASCGITTGISARDRARTVRLLADPGSDPATFTRPGHMVPIATRVGGVLERPGEAEAGVDLAALAGLCPAAVMARIVSPRCPERMADHDELVRFSRDHDLPMISVSDLAEHVGRVPVRPGSTIPTGEVA
jgi:3,4-dihydroxy 2-butanone 4-phosphate synthase/GTP cyclohydrolase II